MYMLEKKKTVKNAVDWLTEKKNLNRIKESELAGLIL